MGEGLRRGTFAMPERNDASAFNGADDEEEEEEEEEEDEEDDAIGGGDGYDDDDDDELGLSKTKKQTTLVGMLREEEEDLNDDEFASLYNIQPSAHERGLADPPVAIVPGMSLFASHFVFVISAAACAECTVKGKQ